MWVIQILGLEIDSKLGINEKFICIKHSKIILYKACKSYKHDLFRKTKKYRFLETVTIRILEWSKAVWLGSGLDFKWHPKSRPIVHIFEVFGHFLRRYLNGI